MLVRKSRGHPADPAGEMGATGRSAYNQDQEAALDMTKRHTVLKLKTPRSEGGFREAFEIGLADLSCWGDQDFDASGYPFPDEAHAFFHDWLSLSRDLEAAMRKVREHGARTAGGAEDAERPQKGQTADRAAPAE
jgi:hypothetical protein